MTEGKTKNREALAVLVLAAALVVTVALWVNDRLREDAVAEKSRGDAASTEEVIEWKQHHPGLFWDGSPLPYKASSFAYCTTSHLVPSASKFTSTRALLPRPSKLSTTPSPNIW